jgi:hypothetical protein
MGTPRDEPEGDGTGGPSPEPTKLGWTTIWNCRDSTEANLAVGKLLAIGLHARVDMEHTAALGSYGGAGPIGTTNIQAIASDAEAARRFLAGIDQRRAERQRSTQAFCPRCGQQAGVRKMSMIGWIVSCGIPASILALLLEWFTVGIFLLSVSLLLVVWPRMPAWRCRSCGNRWTGPEPETADGDSDIAPG